MSNFNLTYQKDGENEQLYYKDAHNNDLYIRSCEDFAPAITQEKSGNPIGITDGADCPIRKLKVILEPIQEGSGDPSPDNIRPITGRDSVTVTRTGKNLLPNDLASGTTRNGVTVLIDASGVISFSGTTTDVTLFNVKIDVNNVLKTGVDYIMSGCTGGTFLTYRLEIYKTVGNNVVNYNGDTPFSLLDTDSGCICRIVIQRGINLNGVKVYPMIRLASDADATYAPPTIQSDTVQLGQTVYGGTVDVIAGKLTVEWENIASYDGEALPGEWISDRDAYAPGTTPTTGAQVCYKLATPVTIDLTPEQLSTLKGENTFSTDGTSIELEYVVDTKTYIDNLFNSGNKTVVKPNDEIKIIDEK